MTRLVLSPFLACALALAFASSGVAEPPVTGTHDYVSAEPGAQTITLENLYRSERFWPYKVTLREPMPSPVTGRTISNRRPAILVRVLPDGRVRLDFAREGQLELPAAATDVIDVANRIRLGEEDKFAPNLVLKLGTRLLDSGSDTGFFQLRPDTPPQDYLLVFADPGSPGWKQAIEALSPLRASENLLAILLPQGERQTTAALHRQLPESGWPIVFVPYEFAPGYTRSILDAANPTPYVVLASPEGRVLFEGPIAEDDPAALRSQIEAAFVLAKPAEKAPEAASLAGEASP